ncbi:MAG: zinc ribbon domain-containing protein [Nevskia sp.]|nr:zinc ribbon domain-containing protein [Nevskia sp.]
MPFYEYVCTSCGAATEVLQRLSDPPETECPECHAHALTKQVSAAGFRLKGGGWYETDFKGGDKRNLTGDAGAPAESAKSEGADAKGAGHTCAAGCSHAPKAAPAAAPAASTDKPAPTVPA